MLGQCPLQMFGHRRICLRLQGWSGDLEREGTKEFWSSVMIGCPGVSQLPFEGAKGILIALALFDFELHACFDPKEGPRVRETLDAVRRRVAVVPAAPFNRLPSSFAHIFAGGYAAGYYSYKWAEVLAADAFEAFEEAGILNGEVARRFVDSILSRGGSRDAMEAFVEFRGRPPDVRPLLRQTGIAA